MFLLVTENPGPTKVGLVVTPAFGCGGLIDFFHKITPTEFRPGNTVGLAVFMVIDTV